ncbi:MAG: sodium:proton antiporter NhaD [Alphaproteobacteria bacterium]
MTGRFFRSICATACLSFCVFLSMSLPAFAAEAGIVAETTSSIFGSMVLAVFAAAYLLVFAEERLQMRKSMPVLVAAGLIWVLVGIAYSQAGEGHKATALLRHNALEYAELLFFLLAAMSYINSMVERGVFDVLRSRLVSANFSLRTLFWVTGALSFAISPIADNLTTALVMGTVVLSLGGRNKAFVTGACVNVVVAANAGGAFSPFGDITTLMVWQKGVVSFGQFFSLFIPSLVNWLIPAALIAFTLPTGKSEIENQPAFLKQGGIVIVFLFLATIATTVLLHHTLELPPFMGMMLGLGFLKLYGYFLFRKEARSLAELEQEVNFMSSENEDVPVTPVKPFNTFRSLREVEWDTLLFFYGIILCVGGIGAMGYLGSLSNFLYGDLGSTIANTSLGLLSAVVDNIPLTFAVLTMYPQMDTGQWLLLTLTAGTGGSLLSIGSAAGVALMGIGKGQYTFLSHLKWSWAILLGYAASILTHLFLNQSLFLGSAP